MTELTITPKVSDKTARFKGTIAAGEHVAVTIKGGAEWIGSDGGALTLRVLDMATGRTLAVFPRPQEVLAEDEDPDEWEASGDDGSDLFCDLNLNSNRMVSAARHMLRVPVMFVLGDTGGTRTLYFKDSYEVEYWPERIGDTVPYDLDKWPKLIDEWSDLVSASARRAASAESAALAAQAAAAAAQAAAESTPGIKGDKGDKGEKGDKGDRGPAALISKMRNAATGKWHSVELQSNGENGELVVAVNQEAPSSAGYGSFDADVTASGSQVPRPLAGRFADTVNVLDFGAGPSYSGATNTAAFQAAFDEVSDGGKIIIPAGVYNLAKGDDDATNYPHGDQPCISLIGKKNVIIEGCGATLQCLVHGQGILEIVECENVVVRGLKFVGYGYEYEKNPSDGNGGYSNEGGSFPKIGASGGAEKGDNNQGVTRGYYDSSKRTFFPICKNNAIDTSNYSGFEGVAEPWGTFGGGYISSGACGVLIVSSKKVKVTECVATGFNCAGFAVGADHFMCNYDNYDIYAEERCEDICFSNCIANKCYSSGFSVQDVTGVRCVGCVAEDIGHPNAQPFDANGERTTYGFDFCDPGYGFTTNRGSRDDGYHGGSNESVCPFDVTVEGCTFRRCVRKGIDSHNVLGMIVKDNYISDCCFAAINIYNGMAVKRLAGNNAEAYKYYEWYMSRDLVVSNNFMYHCGDFNEAFGVGNSAPDEYRGSESSDFDAFLKFSGNTIITGNVIKECFGRYQIVNVYSLKNLIFANNIVDGVLNEDLRSRTYDSDPGSDSATAVVLIEGLGGKGSASAEKNMMDMVVRVCGNEISVLNNNYPYYGALRVRYSNLVVVSENIVLSGEQSAGTRAIYRPYYFEHCNMVTLADNISKGDFIVGEIDKESKIFESNCANTFAHDNRFFDANGDPISSTSQQSQEPQE